MHEKRPNTLFNMVFILATVSIISAGALAATDVLTKKDRDDRDQKNKIEAILKVFPENKNLQAGASLRYLCDKSEHFKRLETNDKVDERERSRILEIFPVIENKILIGYALKTFTEKGYSGKISIMVGINSNGLINETVVIDHKETPGLGTGMSKTSFKNQFIGKSPVNGFKLKVKKDGGDVDAITAATISSRAFCDSIDRAFKVYSILSNH